MIRICNSGQKRSPEGTRVDCTPLCQRPSRGSSLVPFSRSEIRKNKDAEKKKDSANEIGQRKYRGQLYKISKFCMISVALIPVINYNA
jgi:hypothetical protein